MGQPNISDLIEAYIKAILEEQEQIEIRRSEIADRFSCVPSQINYVINTRFTVAQGYNVESKRGGGGYIRIEKVVLNQYGDVLSELDEWIGNTLSYQDSVAILQQLYNYDIISEREANLILTVLAPETFHHKTSEDKTRATMMRLLLERLRYEEEG